MAETDHLEEKVTERKNIEVPFSEAECQTLQAYRPRALMDESATALAEMFQA
jgi:hypothetical protein